MGINSYAVGRRRTVSTFVEKDSLAFTYLVPAKAVTGRFAPQRRSLLPRSSLAHASLAHASLAHASLAHAPSAATSSAHALSAALT